MTERQGVVRRSGIGWKSGLVGLAAIGFAAVKLLKFAWLAKIATSGGSMLLSVFLYSLIFGWGYGAGFIFLLFCHEFGHYLAARQRGLAVGLPTFIPFVGALVDIKDGFRDAETEAYVGIAGPAIGTLSALACLALGNLLDSDLLRAVAYSGFILNLFNLIPLSPLDGGRITQVVSPHIWLIGIPALVALFLYRPSPLLILIAVLAVGHVWSLFRNRNAAEHRRYHDVAWSVRIGYGAAYLALAGFLALMAFELHAALPAT
ncbi:MAG TPA: site-2 protease family protein [Dongiaceae bacterium]|nr:site-2 protease family protein [Dongiaceae bacterium]